MELNVSDFGAIAHGLVAAAFLLLCILNFLNKRRGAIGTMFIVACLATVLWEGSEAYVAWAMPEEENFSFPVLRILESLRTGAWIGFLLLIASKTQNSTGFAGKWRHMAVGTASVVVVIIACTLTGLTKLETVSRLGIPDPVFLGHLVLAVIGILCVENLFRNTGKAQRWGTKYLYIGLAGLFGYDFFLYSEALLFYRVSDDLVVARSIINLLVVPLIVLSARRNPEWSIGIFVSRQAVFHTATLIGAGLYLLLMSAAGFYVRDFGGEWGVVLQIALLFATAVAFLVIFFSGTLRAWLRYQINQNFFEHKYDYREEWLKFIATISSTGQGTRISQRVAEAIANLSDSPEAAIWMLKGDNKFEYLDSWNYRVPEQDQSVDPAFIANLALKKSVLTIGINNHRASISADEIPDWILAIDRAWLIVPLIHIEHVFGFVLLAQPRAPRRVDDEDIVLLSTAGQQAASYLAENASARALAEARQFEEFNRRFAFVLHDIKNLVSQLSLTVTNAERFKDNADFQKDMIDTVRESVEKLNQLLIRLHSSGKDAATNIRVELRPVLNKLQSIYEHEGDRVVFSFLSDDLAVLANEERLTRVLAHLLDNALDSIGDDGQVEVFVEGRGRDAIIEIQDDGIGMDDEFIRKELFRPFRSTKEEGFGIGMFECREFVSEAGGRLDIESIPGKGTTVRIVLPAI